MLVAIVPRNDNQQRQPFCLFSCVFVRLHFLVQIIMESEEEFIGTPPDVEKEAQAAIESCCLQSRARGIGKNTIKIAILLCIWRVNAFFLPHL